MPLFFAVERVGSRGPYECPSGSGDIARTANCVRIVVSRDSDQASLSVSLPSALPKRGLAGRAMGNPTQYPTHYALSQILGSRSGQLLQRSLRYKRPAPISSASSALRILPFRVLHHVPAERPGSAGVFVVRYEMSAPHPGVVAVRSGRIDSLRLMPKNINTVGSRCRLNLRLFYR